MKIKEKNSNNGYVVAGVLLGFGVGCYFGSDQAIITGLFIGIGLGFLLKTISNTSR